MYSLSFLVGCAKFYYILKMVFGVSSSLIGKLVFWRHQFSFSFTFRTYVLFFDHCTLHYWVCQVFNMIDRMLCVSLICSIVSSFRLYVNNHFDYTSNNFLYYIGYKQFDYFVIIWYDTEMEVQYKHGRSTKTKKDY